MGVPAIPMCTQAYTELANLTAAREGMPHLRQVFTPHPVGGKSDDELAAYLVNPDPVSGKQIMKEIVDDLTRPLTADETKTGMQSIGAGAATFGPETADNLQEIFMNNGMTDYMPIIIPTEEKSGRDAQRHEPQSRRSAPHAAPRSRLHLRAVGIHGSASRSERRHGRMPPGIFPRRARDGIRRPIGAVRIYYIVDNLDRGQWPYTRQAEHELRPWRAWSFRAGQRHHRAIVDADGQEPHQRRHPRRHVSGRPGNNIDYNNLVIAEDEKNSPWPPLHTQFGFKPEENVVSIFGGPDVRQGHGARGAGAMIAMFDEQISFMFQSMVGGSGALVILDPLVAKRLVDQGYDTKDKLQDWLWKNTMRTAKDFRESFLASFHLYPLALQGREPYATWYKVPEDTLIPFFPGPRTSTSSSPAARRTRSSRWPT